MNTQNQSQACPSGQSAAGSAQSSVRFATSGLPEFMKRRGIKFSTGENVGKHWLEWVEEGDNRDRLRQTYNSSGMHGVMNLLGVKKTQAYELIATLGWRREKIADDNAERAKKYGIELFRKRRKHLREHYGWVSGMNCCFLKSFEKFYKGVFQIGRQLIPGDCYVCVTTLPFPAVREYMKRHGLKYYVTKLEVVHVEDVPNKRARWVTVRKRLAGPIFERGPWADEEVEKIFSVSSQYPSPSESEEDIFSP